MRYKFSFKDLPQYLLKVCRLPTAGTAPLSWLISTLTLTLGLAVQPAGCSNICSSVDISPDSIAQSISEGNV